MSFCIATTGIVSLKASKLNKNKFERGKIDEFTVESVDIGDLKKIKIGHDNAGKITCFGSLVFLLDLAYYCIK